MEVILDKSRSYTSYNLKKKYGPTPNKGCQAK